MSSPVQSSNTSLVPNGDDQGVSVRVISSPQTTMGPSQSVNPSPSRVNPHISLTSTPACSVRVPTPVLTDLDPVEDDVPPSSPPRPNGYPITSIPSHLPNLEAVVVLSDCTAVNSNAPSSVSPRSPNPSPPSQSSPSQSSPSSPPNLNQHRSPEPSVAPSGGTDMNGNVSAPFNPPPTTCPPTISQPSTPSDSQNPFNIPPPLSESFFLPTQPPTHPINNNNNILQLPSSNNKSHPFQDRWSSVFSDNTSWEDFSNQCYKFADDVVKTSNERQPGKKPVPRRPFRPPARPVNPNRVPLRYCPREAKKIQAMYRMSKKREARKVLDNNSPSYTGSCDDANSFFTSVFGEKHCNTEDVKRGLEDFVPSAPVDGRLYAPISAEEASKKLRSLSNSAPGSDKVQYRHLRSVDPKCNILSSIFNRCLSESDVPEEWKTSSTILIHKKGDSRDVSNFRPIALMSCIYKLFMSILANRLVTFSINNNLLSDVQKSARPTEGCYEHTFILQSLVLDAKRLGKDLFISWLDLKNAFGSVPHDVIKTTLSHLGIPEGIVKLIENVYTNATTVVNTPSGSTPSIPILAGVKQGCPLSPILFNLCVEIILRSIMAKGQSIGPIKYHGCDICLLAYADDLVLIAKDQWKLQQLLDAASSSASLIGLEFRQDKCASISMTYSKKYKTNLQKNDLKIQGRVMPALSEHEHYRYLGVLIGLFRDVESLDKLVDILCVDMDRIHSSLLAPWQKLDAIRTFIQPCLTFALRSGEPLKAALINYRKKLVEVVRSILNLPTRASSCIIFASRSVGGLAFQDPLEEVDIQTVIQAIKMLSSSDPIVSSIARSELWSAVRFAARDNPSPSLTRDFLSGSTEGKLHPNQIRYRTHSLWTRTRSACRRLKISFSVPDNDDPVISTESSGPRRAKSACSFLHQLTQDRASQKLLNLPDQGKVARAMVKDAFGNGSSWMFTGLNMRFKDWRFVHRARMNVVPTNKNKSKWSDDFSPECRVCQSTDETLPHILCHCKVNMVPIRERHNKIVERLRKAVRYGHVRVDQQVPGLNEPCRPDLVITDGNVVTVIDVTCPFENGESALPNADYAKVIKYKSVKSHFQSLGKKCNVFGFVIGCLGTWHPNNEAVLRSLDMSRKYKSLFRKLCCSDVIRGSAEIYYEHMNNPQD